MQFPIVTTVTISEGRLTFHRVNLSIKQLEDGSLSLVGDPAESVTTHLDPSADPIFTQHPDGGWVSPPYDRIKELQSLKIKPEFIDHVQCRCHDSKNITATALKSLEQCGHTDLCPRRPKPVEIAVAPLHPLAPAPQAPLGPPVPGQVPMESKILDRMFNPIAKVATAQPAAPPGGMTSIQLEALMAELGGAGDEGNALSVGLAIQNIGLDPASFRLEVLSAQLWRDYNFTMCQKCGVWRKVMPGSSLCPGCSK